MKREQDKILTTLEIIHLIILIINFVVSVISLVFTLTH